MLTLLDCSWDDITATHTADNMEGEITFVCGRLVKIVKSTCVGSHLSPIGERVTYDHKILLVEEVAS